MNTKNSQTYLCRGIGYIAIGFLLLASLNFFFVAAQQSNKDLTGNWAVRNPNADGTSRNTYLNLKQEGDKITGTIRVTQFFYRITESTGGPDGFTLTASMRMGRALVPCFTKAN